MGLLDSIFGGEAGVVRNLHDLLGTPISLRMRYYSQDATTGEITSLYFDIPATFVFSSAHEAKASADSSGESRSDVREMQSEISGTIAATSVLAPNPLAPSKELSMNECSIVYNLHEYELTSVEPLVAGDSAVMFSVTARRK